MRKVFPFKFLSRGFAKESAVVILAFISTVALYGFILYSYTSLFRTQTTQQIALSSAYLYYRDGYVWRVDIPLSGGTVDPEKFRVEVSVGDFTAILNVSKHMFTVGELVVYGSIAERLASGKISAEVVNGGKRAEALDMFVYLDQLGKLNVVVDDESDGVLDEIFLVRFLPEAPPTPLNLDSTTVLTVGKGSTLPLEYLTVVAAASSKPSSYVSVIDSSKTYLIPVPQLLTSLRAPSLVLKAARGGNTVATILLPQYFALEGSEIRLKFMVSSEVIASPTIKIPKFGTWEGALVLTLR